MYKPFLIFLCFLFNGTASSGQDAGGVLFMLDSVPITWEPEPWNPILKKDIADMHTVRDRATLRALGWGNMRGITFLFTKEFRNRPDSLKRIPSLGRMEMRNGARHLGGVPYTGKFINYYNSGRIMNEGTLLEGRLNGNLIFYFKNGRKKSVTVYKDGFLHGYSEHYYPNGTFMQTDIFVEGRFLGIDKSFFINGRLHMETRWRERTPFDTVITYYSSGAEKGRVLLRRGVPIRSRKKIDAIAYTRSFRDYLGMGNLKEANKAYFRIWKADSTSSDTYFLGGLLLLAELRFREAITEFDKALEREPLMREALAYRALARIYGYKYAGIRTQVLARKEIALTPEGDLSSIPAAEWEKICSDLQRAKELDFSEQYLEDLFPRSLLNDCIESAVLSGGQL